MCGGAKQPYDAYKKGDFANWKTQFDQKAAIQTALANGTIDKATADAQIAALGGGLDKLGNKIKSDASANMEMREVSRQNDVGLGKIGIDKAFTKFGDSYYNGYKSDYNNYYDPQLDRQYKEAVGKTTAALADRGVLDSSIGANNFGDLARQNAEAKTNIANEGLDAANKLRGTVENAKSSLYSLNEASADPQAINAQAIGQATSLVAPPQYSPLGQVFANALQSVSAYQQAKNNAPTAQYKTPYASGAGSSTVIR
ncbi:hypothetical protein [Mesorhizobium sp. M0139]|uniref:hypothetical protein n=1 Tax=Mesorhizobium sp. M0139 TaxID=2956892 RepID=UPI0033381B23